ncbi:protein MICRORCHIDIA 7 isoform X1 [Selaginella moellendorffii]|uniref:protein MICRORCHIDIA 7 isoform X1 n=1 Tax=Selaginella moellendorffii TaxID=88036 RepID=UPI000D1C59DA|nr:protein MICRORCHIDIA 7 isoform X1 [Selaginella moellendorffii]|eukprot:XP_024528529.1 protein MICRORCHIDIA 7 isoform X1 [Selaginella moellendorffii]
MAVEEEEERNAGGAGPSRITGIATDLRKRGAGGIGGDDDQRKKPKIEDMPADFLDFLPNANDASPDDDAVVSAPRPNRCRQFWKAGDYDGSGAQTMPASMDHVRMHPKFLHSNATSHKWALGAIAELLDNALDEAQNGATFVNINVLKNPVDGSPMLLFEDNGGGMTQERLRECMSFGYSAKDKAANMIGQYGNGFKTSTMRLGADVIVFSKSNAKRGGRPTRSVGFLSYSFLRDTMQQDIIVPTLDYEEHGGELKEVQRGTHQDWKYRMDAITKWSPYQSEESIRSQFKKIKGQGTRIIIYNLWEDEQQRLELDFESDPQDIQIRGGRDDSQRDMAEKYPSAKHFFLYQNSLRIYASILYLHLPKNFKITLRNQEIKHHNILSDVMHIEELVYKPQKDGQNGVNMSAKVHLGFLKDAREHIDVQGFNVYHKNRLIKPFWRIWNSSSSQGRGVIGVLEANFVEPAHDKQGFERTPVLQRLEHRLQLMQKKFWNNNCQKVGYQGPPATGSATKKRKTMHEDEILYRPRRADRLQDKAIRSSRRCSSSSSEVSDDEDERPVKEAFPRKAKIQAKKAFRDPNAVDEVDVGSRFAKPKETIPSKPKPVPHVPSKSKESAVAVVPVATAKDSLILDDFEAEEQVEPTDHQLRELEEETNVLATRMERLEEAGNAQLEVGVARTQELEETVHRLEMELAFVQSGLLEECNKYKRELEEEKKQRVLDDAEIRKKLKTLESEKKILEKENKFLREKLGVKVDAIIS